MPKQTKTAAEKCAEWLRDGKKSGLTTKEGIFVPDECRTDYFKGDKLMTVLMDPKKKSKNKPPLKDQNEAVNLANKLIKQQFFVRVEKIPLKDASRKFVLRAAGLQTFDEAAYYVWMYQGSQTRIYMMSALIILGALACCMIQIWPLWLKIGVWWCSVTFLTTFTVLTIVRLVLYCLMWIVGFRGVWLFPNLFDDDATFIGSFQPVFGKGDIVYEEIEEDDADDKKKKKLTPSEKAAEEASWNFGVMNVVLIFGVGLIGCYQLGFFDGEHVPDFVARRDDLQYYFPAISMGEPENATDGTGEGADPNFDPFAAPQTDEVY